MYAMLGYDFSNCNNIERGPEKGRKKNTQNYTDFVKNFEAIENFI